MIFVRIRNASAISSSYTEPVTCLNKGEFAVDTAPAANLPIEPVESIPIEVTPDLARFEASNRRAIDQSANWFYWIAALSLINSLIIMSGSTWSFVFGLTFTKVVDALATQYRVTGFAAIVCLGLNVCAIAAFVILGYFARRCNMWAFVVGLILFVMDTLLLLIGSDVYSFAFHAYVIYKLVGGVMALRRHRQLVGD
jgi:hypothetical protein